METEFICLDRHNKALQMGDLKETFPRSAGGWRSEIKVWAALASPEVFAF